MLCKYKHAKYQPTDEEWVCPGCGATLESDKGGLAIYAGVADFDDFECDLLHDEDFLKCENCGLEIDGRHFSDLVVKASGMTVCPCCNGKGYVKKEKK